MHCLVLLIQVIGRMPAEIQSAVSQSSVNKDPWRYLRFLRMRAERLEENLLDSDEACLTSAAFDVIPGARVKSMSYFELLRARELLGQAIVERSSSKVGLAC